MNSALQIWAVRSLILSTCIVLSKYIHYDIMGISLTYYMVLLKKKKIIISCFL